MSRVIYFMFVIFLSLMITSRCTPVCDQSNSGYNQTVENKTIEFYCASIKLKNIINELIQVISLCSKHVINCQ